MILHLYRYGRSQTCGYVLRDTCLTAFTQKHSLNYTFRCRSSEVHSLSASFSASLPTMIVTALLATVVALILLALRLHPSCNRTRQESRPASEDDQASPATPEPRLTRTPKKGNDSAFPVTPVSLSASRVLSTDITRTPEPLTPMSTSFSVRWVRPNDGSQIPKAIVTQTSLPASAALLRPGDPIPKTRIHANGSPSRAASQPSPPSSPSPNNLSASPPSVPLTLLASPAVGIVGPSTATSARKNLRCVDTTGKGFRCKRRAQAGSDTCWQH